MSGRDWDITEEDYYAAQNELSGEELSIEKVMDTNRSRAHRWHKGTEWTLNDWATAWGGEFGEACNVLKKIKRFEDGLPTDIVDLQMLRIMLANELADALLYELLLASAAGIDLAAAVKAKFNKVSESLNFPERL